MQDPDGRVLLLRYDDPPPSGVHWATPGGGIEPGESARTAALRELREETGWADVVLGPELGRTRRLLYRCGHVVQQDEVHFAARVGTPRRPVEETGHEDDEIAAWGWFAGPEAAALGTPLVPPQLLAWLAAPSC